MPIYEYVCLDCRTQFDSLRSMQAADDAIACESCGSEQTSRMISVFNAHTGTDSSTSTASCACASGGACGCAA